MRPPDRRRPLPGRASIPIEHDEYPKYVRLAIGRVPIDDSGGNLGASGRNHDNERHELRWSAQTKHVI
jgi:hypothetical protein